MHAKARLFGHSIHQMLIVFPLGLLATSLVFDIAYEASKVARWAEVTFVMITAGIIGGLVSAVFGLIDWLAIPKGTRAKRIGAWHGGLNVVVVGLFIVSWALRVGNPSYTEPAPLVLAIIAVALALVTGWLGGELIDRLGVGVDEGANVNAPSSLSRPARDVTRGAHG